MQEIVSAIAREGAACAGAGLFIPVGGSLWVRLHGGAMEIPFGVSQAKHGAMTTAAGVLVAVGAASGAESSVSQRWAMDQMGSDGRSWQQDRDVGGWALMDWAM